MTEYGKVADLAPGRCRLRVTGEDRVTFLHGQCTNDIKVLAPGGSCYAAFLNAKGKMRGEAYILCRDDAILLEASSGLRESLEKFVITEDVTIEDVSATFGAWLVTGNVPASALTFAHALGTGVLSAEPLPVTMSAEELEAMRIEAAVPKWGVDMDETTIPVEAGLAKSAISYDKGCYIGQETIARIKTYGHVNRHLVQLKAEAAKAGSAIVAGGAEVGRVTSAGQSLGLGYVRREWARPGVHLQIENQTVEVTRICGE